MHSCIVHVLTTRIVERSSYVEPIIVCPSCIRSIAMTMDHVVVDDVDDVGLRPCHRTRACRRVPVLNLMWALPSWCTSGSSCLAFRTAAACRVLTTVGVRPMCHGPTAPHRAQTTLIALRSSSQLPVRVNSYLPLLPGISTLRPPCGARAPVPRVPIAPCASCGLQVPENTRGPRMQLPQLQQIHGCSSVHWLSSLSAAQPQSVIDH